VNILGHIDLHCEYQDHFEVFQAPQPLPHSHPPYLKQKVRQAPAPDLMQDDWKKGAKKSKRKRAKREMKQIVQKTLNQGRPTMIRHSHGGDPNLWSQPG
jgi:hypothetical protein